MAALCLLSGALRIYDDLTENALKILFESEKYQQDFERKDGAAVVFVLSTALTFIGRVFL